MSPADVTTPDSAPPIPPVDPVETAPIPDSEGSDLQWVDPLHQEYAEKRMPDEIAIEAGQEAADAEADDETGPNEEQLAELVASDTDDEAAASEAAQPAEQAEEETADGDAAGSDAAESDETPEPTEKSRAERRAADPEIQARRKVHEENDALKQRIEALENAAAPEAEPAPELLEEPTLPTMEDHNFDTTKWGEAMGKYTQDAIAYARQEDRQTAEQATADKDATEAETAAQTRHDETMKGFREREADFREAHDDYDTVLYAEGVRIPNVLTDSILQSENGPALAYYLATHQDESIAIGEMSPVDAGRETARIELTLAAEQATGKEAEQAAETPSEPAMREVPVETSAPKPAPHLSGGGVSQQPNLERMGHDEYRAGRMSGKIK